MGSFAKWLGILVAGVLVVALVAVLLLAGNLDSAVKAAIERFGPRFTGAPVTVDAVELSPTTGEGELRGIVLGNPEGYEGDQAFGLGRVRIAVDPASLLEDVIVLREVIVDGARVDLLVGGPGRSNLQQILRNVQAAAGTSEEAPADTGPGKKLVIERFAFTGASASVSAPGVGNREVSVPDVNLSDIGRRSNGATAAEAVRQVMEPVIAAIVRAAAEGGLRDALEGRTGELRERLEGEAGQLQDRLRSLNPLRPQNEN
ncbi:MAG: hypothetical protein V2J02_09480 [Pseudomonadales bacterium]|jgi:hypothetical protein|nr:hypothetical protein [Pseudomonadales bacterium]